MKIPISENPKERSCCVFCQQKTNAWTLIDSRLPSQQVCCCAPCAEHFEVSDVPSARYLRERKNRELWKMPILILLWVAKKLWKLHKERRKKEQAQKGRELLGASFERQERATIYRGLSGPRAAPQRAKMSRGNALMTGAGLMVGISSMKRFFRGWKI